MIIQLQKFSSETTHVQDMLLVVKGFTTKLFLWIFLNSIIYETCPGCPIQNFLRIQQYEVVYVSNVHSNITIIHNIAL